MNRFKDREETPLNKDEIKFYTDATCSCQGYVYRTSNRYAAQLLRYARLQAGVLSFSHTEFLPANLSIDLKSNKPSIGHDEKRCRITLTFENTDFLKGISYTQQKNAMKASEKNLNKSSEKNVVKSAEGGKTNWLKNKIRGSTSQSASNAAPQITSSTSTNSIGDSDELNLSSFTVKTSVSGINHISVHQDIAQEKSPFQAMTVLNSSGSTNPKVFIIALKNKAETLRWACALARVCCSAIEDIYTLGKVIGQGAYGVVFAARDAITGEKRAVKLVRRIKGDKKSKTFIRREVEILRSVDHPNIIKTYDIFEVNDKLYFAFDFLSGGELFDIIAEESHFDEQRAAQVMRQIMSGISYLHGKNIVHRDIKPENILCVDKEWPLEVKLTDFGLSNIMSDQSAMLKSHVGTPYYFAPELYKSQKGYGKKVDIWSCGIVLFIMLAGKFPFYGDTDDDLKGMMNEGVQFPNNEWANVSSDAKDLVRSMLSLNPANRPTAEEVLQHKWLFNRHSGYSLSHRLSNIHSSRRFDYQTLGRTLQILAANQLSNYVEEPDAGPLVTADLEGLDTGFVELEVDHDQDSSASESERLEVF